MPREQCIRGGVITPAIDLFSLGVTLYEGVSGARPFSDGDRESDAREEKYPQLVQDPRPLHEVTQVPPKLEQVIMACLRHDPARRPASAIDVGLALESVLEDMHLDELLAWPRGLPVMRDQRD